MSLFKDFAHSVINAYKTRLVGQHRQHVTGLAEFRFLRSPFSVMACLLLIFPVLCCAADEAEQRQQLQQLAKKIQQLQTNISSSSKELETLNTQLKKSEIELSSLQKDINRINTAIGGLNTELASLSTKKTQLLEVKEQQKSTIITEINTSYRLGREQTLKLILNQEDPEKVSRALKYHHYFLKARAEKLSAYVATLHSLEEVEESIQLNREELTDTRTQLSQQQDQLVAQQQQRQHVLAALQKSVRTDEQRLEQLRLERKRLETVIQQLSESITALSLPSSAQPFHKLKGKMSWPAQGKLERQFGSPRNTRIKWDGWLISAPEGTPVKAIHHGRVIFADYLRGQGMLLIIDHGNGYMSLYAHNQVVLKETGDWVQQGETIAKVGNTGGQRETALYFEIRHNGKPSNPGIWLSGA